MKPCNYCGKPIDFIKTATSWKPIDPGGSERHQCKPADAKAHFAKDISPLAKLDAETLALVKQNIAESRSQDDPGIVVPIGDGAQAMKWNYYPFQLRGIQQMVKRHEQGFTGILLGDEPGVGKTVQACGYINLLRDELGKNPSVLIVCWKTLKSVWMEHLENWLSFKAGIETGNARHFPPTNIVVINYDVLHKHQEVIGKRHWDLLILDEAHACKNSKTRRTKSCLSVKADRRIYVTGSPIVNRPADLWTLIHSLCPDIWGDVLDRNYYDRYFCGANPANGWDRSGHKHLKELHDLLRGFIMVRRLKAEVLPDLPPKVRKVIMLEPETKEAKEAISQEHKAKYLAATVHEAWQSLKMRKHELTEEEYINAIKALNEQEGMAWGASSIARHQTALVKVSAIIEHVKQVLEESDKVVVFAHHLDVIEAIAKPFDALVLTGKTTEEERTARRNMFQSDKKSRVMVAGITVGGQGITLTAASRMVFAELDWRPAIMSQAEDRCHRIGQMDSVLIEHVVLDGSIDERMTRTVLEKQAVLDAALDAKGEPAENVKKLASVVPAEDFKKVKTRQTKLEERLAKYPLYADGLKRSKPN